MLSEEIIRGKMESMLELFAKRADDRFLDKAEAYREILEISRDEFEKIFNQINKEETN